jgi:hypothetical protein
MRHWIRAAQRAWVRHQLQAIAADIEDEERSHQLHARRLDHLLSEKRARLADLRLLEHGPQRTPLASTQLAGGSPLGSDGRGARLLELRHRRA